MLTELLVIPSNDAVIVTVPTVMPVINPPDGWVNSAIDGLELLHVTSLVISVVAPEAYNAGA